MHSSYSNVLVMSFDNSTIVTWSLQEAREDPRAKAYRKITVLRGPPATVQSVEYCNYKVRILRPVWFVWVFFAILVDSFLFLSQLTCMSSDGAIWKQDEGVRWREKYWGAWDYPKFVLIDTRSPPELSMKRCFMSRGIVFVVTGTFSLVAGQILMLGCLHRPTFL